MGKKEGISIRLVIIIIFAAILILTNSIISIIVFSNWRDSVNDIIQVMEYDNNNYNTEGISILENQFISEIVENIFVALILSIVAIFISIIVYMKGTSIIFKPIYDLIAITNRFKEGDFSQTVKVYGTRELRQLSDSINSMAEQLNILINSLEEKVKERTMDLENANLALKESEENIKLLLNSTAEAIYGIDLDGNCTFCNASCLRMLGYEHRDKLIGKNIHALIHNKHLDGRENKQENCKILSALVKGEGVHVDDEVFWRADGSYFPVEYYSYPQYKNGKIVGAVVNFMDITDRKKAENEIVYLSYHDQLTGLYNRRYFEEELKRLDTGRSYPLSIIMADMNGLKLINDSFGHNVGDNMIKKVADILSRECRQNDIIARLGGDEFVILLTNTGESETEHIIRRIKNIVSREEVHLVNLSISFGYATKNNTNENISDILKKAEDNMYKHKLLESQGMRDKTINILINTLYETHPIEESHGKNVSAMSVKIGEAIGMKAGDLEELKTAGLLHDIGKIAIDGSILTSRNKLSEDELKEIRRHPEIGYRILSSVNNLSGLAEYVLAHHERWNGSGYPKGLKGEEIPLQSRIIAIADAYDAMTNGLKYSIVLSKNEAIDELKRNAGVLFDPHLVNVFLKIINFNDN